MRAKISYRVRNWSYYNRALVDRGDISLWLNEEVIGEWYAKAKSRKMGRPHVYGDKCIEVGLSLRALFSLPLRSTQGFLKSFSRLLGLSLRAPSYSTLSRRAEGLPVKFYQGSKKVTDIVVDSTGLKIYGEGEWKMRLHGKSKQRMWRKLHIAMDPNNFQVVSMELSEAYTHDTEEFPKLLSVLDSAQRVYADGAYLSRTVFKAIHNVGAKPRLPLQRGAVPTDKADSPPEEKLRDQMIREIWAAGGRMSWKKDSDYHKRSLVETQMYRIKQLLSARLQNRKMSTQTTEAKIKMLVLNKLTCLGMPQSYKLLR